MTDVENLSGGALLAASDAGPRMRPLRAWGADDRARVEHAIGSAHRAWRDAWGLSGDASHDAAGADRCEPASDAVQRLELAEARWQAVPEAAGGIWAAPWRAALPERAPRAGTPGCVELLTRSLFGASPFQDRMLHGERRASGDDSTSIALEVSRAAWADWGRRLLVALGAEPSANYGDDPGRARELLQPWSGALVLTVSWCEQVIPVLLSPERVARFLGRPLSAAATPREEPHGLTSIWHALGPRPVQVRVHTDPVELDLGSLASLRVGDVVRTSHPLEVALKIRVEGAAGHAGVLPCAGFLGKVARARAVELLPISTPREARGSR